MVSPWNQRAREGPVELIGGRGAGHLCAFMHDITALTTA